MPASTNAPQRITEAGMKPKLGLKEALYVRSQKKRKTLKNPFKLKVKFFKTKPNIITKKVYIPPINIPDKLLILKTLIV